MESNRSSLRTKPSRTDSASASDLPPRLDSNGLCGSCEWLASRLLQLTITKEERRAVCPGYEPTTDDVALQTPLLSFFRNASSACGKGMSSV
jgi:hypothetical protein